MSISPTTSPSVSTESARHCLLWHLLPLMAVALVLCWLSKSFLALNWQLLFQVKAQFTTLESEERIGLLLPLLILVAQVLAMSLAWGALIWLAGRESVRLLTMLMGKKTKERSQDALLRPTTHAKPAEQTVVAHQPSALGQGQVSVLISDRRSRLISSFPTSGSKDRQSAHPLHMAPTPRLKGRSTGQRLLMPGRVERTDSEEAHVSAQQPEPASMQMRPVVEALPSVVDLPTLMVPAEKTTNGIPFVEANQSIQRPDPSVLSEDEEQEFDPSEQEESNFSAVLNALGFLPLAQEPPGEIRGREQDLTDTAAPDRALVLLQEERLARTKQGSRQKEEAGSPYDVQAEVREAFQEGGLLKEQPGAEKEEKAVEPEQLFVFGNPFDGPLPDVFQHDEELKRSILEQHQTTQKPRESREPAKTRARAKKSRVDVPASPQKHS